MITSGKVHKQNRLKPNMANSWNQNENFHLKMGSTSLSLLFPQSHLSNCPSWKICLNTETFLTSKVRYIYMWRYIYLMMRPLMWCRFRYGSVLLSHLKMPGTKWPRNDMDGQYPFHRPASLIKQSQLDRFWGLPPFGFRQILFNAKFAVFVDICKFLSQKAKNLFQANFNYSVAASFRFQFWTLWPVLLELHLKRGSLPPLVYI